MKPAPFSIAVGILLLSLATVKLPAQNIPNAGFDSIYLGGIDRVYQWVTSDAVYFINDTVDPFPPFTYYPEHSANHHFLIKTVQINYTDPDTSHYLKSLVLNNLPELKYPDGSQFNSYICNGVHFYTDAKGYIDMHLGGGPFPYRPGLINGNYKFFDSLSSGSDCGRVEALLKKWNPVTSSVDTIALATSTTELAPSSTWKAFSIPFEYQDTAIPDSIVVVIYSSTFSTAPTHLYIDDIHFDFTTSAPLAVKPFRKYTAYPNPCYRWLFITPTPRGPVHFTIMGLQGTTIVSGYAADGRMDISSLPPGPYLMILQEENQMHRMKVLKVE